MAPPADIILDGLLKLGVDIEDEDLRRKLAALRASGKVNMNLLNIEEMLQDLSKFDKAVKASAKDLKALALAPDQVRSKADLEKFRKQTSQLQAYVDMVSKLRTELNGLGRAVSGTNLRRELAPLQQVLDEANAVVSKVKGITTAPAREINQAAEQRAIEKRAKREAQIQEKARRRELLRLREAADKRAEAKAAKQAAADARGRAAFIASEQVKTPVGLRGRGVQLGADLSDAGSRAATRERLRKVLQDEKAVRAREAQEVGRLNEAEALRQRQIELKRIKDIEKARELAFKEDIARTRRRNDEIARLNEAEALRQRQIELKRIKDIEKARDMAEKEDYFRSKRTAETRQKLFDKQAEDERKGQLRQREAVARAYDAAEKEDRSRARKKARQDADQQFNRDVLNTRFAEGKQALAAGRPSGFSELDAGQARAARQYAAANQSRLTSLRTSYANSLGPMAQQTQAAGRAARAAAADVAALDARLRELNATSEKSSGRLGQVGLTLQAFLRYAIGYAALYQIVNGVTAVARSVVELDTELRNIQAITNSTDKEMSDLANTIGQVATQTKFSVTEIAQATQTLAQAGIAAEEMQTALSASANFAAATGSSLQDAADLISTARDVFKDLDDTTLADQLAKAVNLSKLTGEDLKTILSLAGQTAEQFGLSSEQFLGAVGTLRNAGLKASTVATGLRQGMLEVFSPDATLIKALQNRYRALGEEMGEAAIRARFQAFTKGENPLLAAATELQRLGFNGEGAGDFARAFDVRAINALQALINNLDSFAGSTAAITFGQSAAEGATTSMRSLSSSVENLGSNISLLASEKSGGLVGWLAEVSDGASAAIQRMRELQQARDAGVEAPGSDGSTGSRVGAVLESALSNAGRGFSSAFDGFTAIPSVLTGDRKVYDPERIAAEQANLQAKEGAKLQATVQAKIQQYIDAAKAFDVTAAELGGSVGKTAEGILKMQDASVSLTTALEQTFGQSGEEVRKAVADYTKLAPSLRPKALEELKAQFPQLAEGVDDRTFFNLGRQLKTVDDGLKEYSKEITREILQAGEVIQRMGDRTAPQSAEELRAIVLRQQLQSDEQIQAIVAGTSTETAQVQIEAIRRLSQTLADANTQMAEGLQNSASGSLAQLQREIRRVITNRPAEARAPELKAAVTSFLASLQEVDDRTIATLQENAAKLREAAQSQPKAEADASLAAAGQIEAAAASKETQLVGARRERVQATRTSINPTLQSADFIEWLKGQFPEGGTEFDSVVNAANRRDRTTGAFVGVTGTEAQANDSTFRYADKWTKAYKEVQQQADVLAEKQDAQTRERLAAEDALSKAQEARQAADTDRDFKNLPGLIEQERQAEQRMQQFRLDEARARERGSLGDPEAFKQARDARLTEEAKVNKINEQAAKRQGEAARKREKEDLEAEAKTLKLQIAKLSVGIQGALDIGDVEKAKELGAERDTLNQKWLAVEKERLGNESKHSAALKAEYDELEKTVREFGASLEDQLALIDAKAAARQRVVQGAELSFAESRDPAKDARFETFGAPLTREERTRRLSQDKKVVDAKVAVSQSQLAGYEGIIAKGRPTNDLDLKAYNEAQERALDLRGTLVGLRQEQAMLNAEIDRTGATWMKAFEDGGDLEILKARLQSAQYSVENLGQALQENLASAFDAVGDAAADALLEQRSFADALIESLGQVAEEYLRTLIKTGINSLATGALKVFSGDSGEDKDNAKAAGASSALSALQGFLGVGGEPGTSEQNPLYVSVVDAPTGAPGAEGEKGPVQGFIEGLKEKFFGLFGSLGDTLKGVFGPLMRGLSALFGGGSSGQKNAALVQTGLQIAGMFLPGPGAAAQGASKGMTDMPMRFANVAATGGIIGTGGQVLRAATGGIMKGPGSGTSDSLRGFVVDKKGRRQPIHTSSGEGILNARAVANLGEDFVHEANSGRFHKAQSSFGGQSSALASASRSVADKIQSAAQSSPPVRVDGSVHISNMMDSGSMVATGAKTPVGRRAFMNFIKDNRDEIRQIVR